MEYVNTFDRHSKEPLKTFDQYSREKCRALGSDVLSKKVVYLDTRYWVILMKAQLGESKDQNEQQLLVIIETLYKSGKCIFPISQDVFLEVVKQTDPRTLNATVDLIDHLSGGVSLISFDDRIGLEFLQFIYESTNRPTYKAKEMVWTKLSYLLGYVHPDIKGVDDKTRNILGKVFIDNMWSATLADMLKSLGADGISRFSGWSPSWAAQANEGKVKFQHENKSFKQLFMSEIAGIVDVCKEDLADSMKYLFEKETSGSLSSNELEDHGTAQLMSNMVCNLFRLNKIDKQLPTFNIMAGLHAAVRQNPKQNFENNDTYDFRHAAGALPYCDYFFTERPLTNLLTQKLLGYDKRYDCVVKWKVKDSLEILSNI